MNSMNLVILTITDYSTLCWIAGAGWAFFLTTLVAAVMIDNIKWRKWVQGQ